MRVASTPGFALPSPPVPTAAITAGGVFAALLAGPVVALDPLHTVLAALILALAALVIAHPPVAAYLLLGTTPLVVGMDRGTIVPLMRPNEALLLLCAGALAARFFFRLIFGAKLSPKITAVDLSILAMAVVSSLLPLLWMASRGKAITADDVLFAMTMWKYYVLFVVVRSSIRTPRQVGVCLWLCLGVGCVVAVIGILQSLQLFGVPGMLATHYAPEADAGALDNARGTSTIASSIAMADVMIFNLAIALAWIAAGGRRVLLAAAAVLFVFGAVASGQFSGVIGLVVGCVAVGWVTGQLHRLARAAIPTAMVVTLALAPVIQKRLRGFEEPEGIPPSWSGRLENLQRFFWPELLRDWNWVLGVRPSGRVKAPESWRDWVWIESGHTWLLWTGGIPLLVAFFAFLWAAMRATLETARRRMDEIGVAAAASFTSLVVIAVLMTVDPHLVVRGSADLSFPLLALALTAYARHAVAHARPLAEAGRR